VIVTPPAANPWDTAEIAAQALAVLRLDPADQDAARIAELAVEATELVDGYLDLEAPYDVIPSLVEGSAVTVTVELYRRKDAPFGVSDAWSADGGVVRVSSDPLRGVRGLLGRYKGRWGVA
jgi:hypothetical protein